MNKTSGELLRLKYQDLGDFGGTMPSRHNWHLEIAGPTFQYKDTLKRLGLRWQPHSKTWGLVAVDNGYKVRQYAAIRKKQKAAWPILKKLVEDHNAAERASRPAKPKKTPREIVERLQQKIRQNRWLEEHGIEIEYDWPSRYSISEAKVLVKGRTFDYKSLLKRNGFRWNGSQKCWEISMDRWEMMDKTKFLQQLSKEVALNNRVSSVEDVEMSQRIAATLLDREKTARYRWQSWDYVIHPEQMLSRAVYWGKLTKEEMEDAIAGRNNDLAQIAEEAAMYIHVEPGHGFGTSDANSYIKQMLKDYERVKARKGL